MDQHYDVFLGDKSVGNAQVAREGLYYRIRCSCHLSGETICRVLVRSEMTEESLGILVPKDGDFYLETRLPVKKLGTGDFRFLVVPRHKPMNGLFVPLCPQEPFRYLTELKTAYLHRKDGQIGVVIKEPGCN